MNYVYLEQRVKYGVKRATHLRNLEIEQIKVSSQNILIFCRIAKKCYLWLTRLILLPGF